MIIRALKGKGNMGFKWLEKTDLSECIDIAKALLHLEVKPLIYGICCHPFTSSTVVPIANMEVADITTDKEAYRKWLKGWEKRLDEVKDIWGILAYLNSAYNMCFLKYAKDYMSLKDFSKCLSECWISQENPNNDVNVSLKESVRFFKKADKNFLMDKEELEFYDAIPETVTVYRGVAVGRVPNGLSWTMDYDTALWFANRFNRDSEKGYVQKATIDKKHCLAYLNRRNEKEIVVDTFAIKDMIEKVE